MNSQSFAFAALLLISSLGLSARANMREFHAIKGKEKLYLELIKSHDGVREYMMVQGTKFPEDGYVFLVKHLDSGITPYNEAAPIGFYEGDQQSKVQGSLKTIWSLLYKQKDISMVEVTVTGNSLNLAEKYKIQETGKYQSNESSLKHVQTLLAEKCKTKPTVKITDENPEFNAKAIMVGEALASLCVDKDYKEAIAKLTRVDIVNDSSLKHSGKADSLKGVLTIKFSKAVENTFFHIKVLLQDVI